MAYYGDARMTPGYSMLDYWFYPDVNYFTEVWREAKQQEEEIKKEREKKEKENAKGAGGGSGGGGGGGGGGIKKGGGGGGGEGGEKNEGGKGEGGEKGEGGGKGGGGKKQPKVVEIKASLCCDSCARKMKKKIEKLDGVESVHCDVYDKKVIVTTAADTKPETVLKQAQKVKKDAVMVPKKEGEKKGGDKKEGGDKDKN